MIGLVYDRFSALSPSSSGRTFCILKKVTATVVVVVAASLLVLGSSSDALPMIAQSRQQQRSMRLAASSSQKQQLGEFEPLTIAVPNERQRRYVRLQDFTTSQHHDGPIPYQQMWDLQKVLVSEHLDRLGSITEKGGNSEGDPSLSQFITIDNDDLMSKRIVKDDNDESNISSSGDAPMDYSAVVCMPNGENRSIQPQQWNNKGCDTILMLQHTPVYTLGTGSDPNFILNQNTNTVDIVRIERGGEVTYHGPGQLVIYPILDLRGYRLDIHWYMRALEEAILVALESVGVKGATREDDVTGVWVSNRKIAALGIKARRWITMHGLAVNVDQRSLHNFEGIVPCGLLGREVTCINNHLDENEQVTVEEFAWHMRKALESVFEVQLIPTV